MPKLDADVSAAASAQSGFGDRSFTSRASSALRRAAVGVRRNQGERLVCQIVRSFRLPRIPGACNRRQHDHHGDREPPRSELRHRNGVRRVAPERAVAACPRRSPRPRAPSRSARGRTTSSPPPPGAHRRARRRRAPLPRCARPSMWARGRGSRAGRRAGSAGRWSSAASRRSRAAPRTATSRVRRGSRGARPAPRSASVCTK